MKPRFPHAFTLVEILVVIAIIAIFAVIGLGSYRGARSTLVIDLDADKLVAFLQSAREETRAAPHCVAIESHAGGTIARYQVPFLNPVAGCAETPPSGNQTSTLPFRFDKDVSLMAITLDDKKQTSAKIIFAPPNGIISFQPAASREVFSLALKSVPGLTRSVSINGETGQIERAQSAAAKAAWRVIEGEPSAQRGKESPPRRGSEPSEPIKQIKN